MFLTLLIPNSIYLPNSEGTPDLRLCTVPMGEQDENPGVKQIHWSLAFEYSEECMGILEANDALEIFKGGVAFAHDINDEEIPFSESMLKENTPDAQLYRWLKQANDYSRVGLTEADESNPPLEIFVVTADSPDTWA